MLEDLSKRQRLLILTVAVLSLMVSGFRYHAGESYFADGYIEEALIFQEKILNPSKEIDIAPDRPDKDLIFDKFKKYLKNDPSWKEDWLNANWSTKKLIRDTIEGPRSYNIQSSPYWAPTRPFYPFLIALFNIFINNVFAASAIVNILAIIGSLYLIGIFAKELVLPKEIKFIAILFFLSSSTTITFFISGMTDYTAQFFGMLAIFYLIKYFKTENIKYSIYYTISASLSIFTREAFVFLSILPLFLGLKRKILIPKILMILVPPILFLSYLYLFDLIAMFIRTRILYGGYWILTHPYEKSLTFLLVSIAMVVSIYPIFLYPGIKQYLSRDILKNPLLIFTFFYSGYLILSPTTPMSNRVWVPILLPICIFSANGVLVVSKKFTNNSEFMLKLIVSFILFFNYSLAVVRIL